MTHITRMLAAAFTICSAFTASAEYFGYCTDVAERNTNFRLGNDEGQGMAICLDADKIAALKGCAITGVNVLLGSSRTTDGTIEVFVRDDINGEPLRSATVQAPTAIKWGDTAFDTPYVITGDERELYIGYTARINVKSSMLMSDHTQDTQGTSWFYSDGAWHDAYGLGLGNVSVRAIIDGAPAFADLMIKSVPFDAYYKASTPYTLDAQVYNFGTEPITSFDVVALVDGVGALKQSYDGLSLKHGECLDIKLPTIESAAEGDVLVEISVENINGSDDGDQYTHDNVKRGAPYFYPASMERSVLLEGFTGQTCHNCPEGHAIIGNFLEAATTTPVIEVMHHAGYQPDFMTMSTDVDYMFYFGGGSTYAPAVMMNRTAFPTLSPVPAMNVTAAALATAYHTIEKTQPYVSLGIETAYDPATRRVDVTTTVKKHRDLPATSVVNLMLVQDGIVAMQTPYGDGYKHNAVFRGTLTQNSWGITLSPDAGDGDVTFSTPFILPEGIFADYYDYDSFSEKQRQLYTFATDADNMYIVAYVSSYDQNNPTLHTVYNAVSVPLGQSYTQGGLSALPSIADEAADLTIKVAGGRISADGCDTLSVYDLEGRMVDARSSLRSGVYIVRATKGAHVTIKKVVVR